MPHTNEEMRDLKKKYNHASFCWNGDNKTGVDFAKKTRNKLFKDVNSYGKSQYDKGVSDLKKSIREEIGLKTGPGGTREDKYSEGFKEGRNKVIKEILSLKSLE